MGFIHRHRHFFAYQLRTHFAWLPDELFLRILFRIKVGHRLHLHQPKTYNEKLQWLKLYDHNPLYTILVDKQCVKQFVTERIGSEHLIPTIGLWSRAEDIDWSALPDRFVLKCTHDSGGLIICRDKQSLDIASATERLRRCLSTDFYKQAREWPYRNVVRRIIAEPYIESPTGDLKDYKFFCFNGVVKALFVASDRNNDQEETKFDFFDPDFHHLPFTNGHPNANTMPQKPRQFETMKNLAQRLSQGFPHVRVDLYEVGDRVLFGEMTFFHHSGLEPFSPHEWDLTFGEWLQLPSASNR